MSIHKHLKMKQILLILLCVFHTLAFPLGSDDEKRAAIDEFMEGVLKCRSIPGWSISIVHNGSVFLTKGYGLADVEEAIPATEDTLFALASISKSFTATSLAKIFSETDG